MAEGVAEREGQPIISNLFPVSRDSVSTAFKELSPAAEEEEKRILGETNPYVLASLKQFIEPYAEENAKQMRRGALIFHRALRKEAKSKGVVLPTFSEQFVKDYDEQAQSSADKYKEEAHRDRKLNAGEVGREFRRKNLVVFRNLEPEFSEIVEREFGAQPNWLPEEDFTYRGIIDQRLLFRAGCSDRKNYQP